MLNLFNIVPTEEKADRLEIAALILAAGFSSRMGEFKPLLEINGISLLESAIALFRNAGIEKIVTVIGCKADSLIPVLGAVSSSYVVNEHYRDGMFSSIRKGAAELQGKCDAFFLLPVDIPCVRAATVRQLLKKYNANPSTLVCYPVFDSTRGHPPLVASRLIDDLLSYTGEGGMRGFLRSYEDHAVNVPVADPFVRFDVDTSEDFRRLKDELKNYTIE